MRWKLTLLFSIIVICGLQAQFRKIPAEVTDAFKSRYPHAEQVTWKDDFGSFEAEFLLNNYEMCAHFSSKGDWLRSERMIKYNELPQMVKDGFEKSRYAGWEKGSIHEISKSTEALQYRMLIKKSGAQKKYLFFDANGKLNRESLTL